METLKISFQKQKLNRYYILVNNQTIYYYVDTLYYGGKRLYYILDIEKKVIRSFHSPSSFKNYLKLFIKSIFANENI